jgi:sec-independent protein translocase protein TatA
MGDIGIPELMIILVIIIIVFGPARIQGLGASLGASIRGFREATRDDPTAAPTEPPLPEVNPPPPDANRISH